MTIQPTAAAVASERSRALFEVSGLSKHFPLRRSLREAFSKPRYLHAVDDLSLEIYPREIVALVGESGSGKSTVARLLALLYRPTSGEIRYRGNALGEMHSRRELMAYRRRVQMILQDPFSSLNPVYPASHGLQRALKIHQPQLGAGERREKMVSILESVGLTPASEFIRKYPYELSGGQRQRIGFAQALAAEPELILADEPVSMLDVSIRIGVLNLMAELRRSRDVSFLYITHDIASARYVADRMFVMYAGQIVESGPVDDLLQHPKHPYTQLLLSAVPAAHEGATLDAVTDNGEPPRVVDPGPGCRFRPRCPFAIDRCATETPPLRLLRPAHMAACHVAQPETTA